jgi:tetratricopeptide (TPR) repeat protein
VNEYLLSFEPYIASLYAIIVHVIISFVLALLLSSLTSKRFKSKGKEVQRKDKLSLEGVANKNFLYKKLFSVSLRRNNRITNVLFLFIFNLAMPIIGYIFSIWITLYLKNVRYKKRVTNTNILNLDEFGISFLKVQRIFGEGFMGELINNQDIPRSKKLKALSSLSGNLSPANLKIIRSTLSSKDDEIRMFGYSTINKAEKSINTKINAYLETYSKEKNKKEQEQSAENIANAAKELATLYWELVYTELSHESLKVDFLKEAKKYIKVARKFYKLKRYELENKIEKLNYELLQEETDKTTIEIEEKIKNLEDNLIQTTDVVTKLYVLMGRVYMSEKDYENASTELTIAQELNENKSSFILPYLAEIQFLLGNYTVVSSIMNRSQDLNLNTTLNPIIEQWKKS